MELKNMTEIYRKKDKVFYRDGNKLIKLFEGNYPKENILNEALNQARVERTALHIPRIEAVTSIEGKWAIVMEYIEGETLAALMKKNPSKEEDTSERSQSCRRKSARRECRCSLGSKIRCMKKFQRANIPTR